MHWQANCQWRPASRALAYLQGFGLVVYIGLAATYDDLMLKPRIMATAAFAAIAPAATLLAQSVDNAPANNNRGVGLTFACVFLVAVIAASLLSSKRSHRD